MSQSTVTTRLQRLERELGYPVFHRLPGGVQITESGRTLLPLAERMVEIEECMVTPEKIEIPILRIMSGRAFVSVDVPACLSRMMRVSNVHLRVRMGLYDEMVDALLSHEVDFCFLGEPIFHPHVRLLEFPDDHIDLIVPKHHHLTHNFPGLGSLHQEAFIAFSQGTAPFRQRTMTLLNRAHVFPNVRMELDSIDGIKAMVSAGLGVSLLPRRTLHDATEKGYIILPIDEPGWTRPTLLAYPDVIESRATTKQFIAVVEDFYKTHS
jgi:DNA-binding transcriptional LysR family regulator